MKIIELFEGRTQPVNDHIEDVLSKVSLALKKWQNGVQFFRVIRSFKNKIGFIDPQNFKRTSAYTKSNVYTIWIDNHPSWQQYPKRSKSLICTTNNAYSDYVYAILPIGNPKIGVTPLPDIQSNNKKTPIELNELSTKFFSFLKLTNLIPEEKSQIDSYRELISYMKKADEWWQENNRFKHGHKAQIKYFRNLFVVEKSILKTAEKYLIPEELGFDLFNFSDMPAYDDREIWFSGKAYLIEYNYFDKVIN